MLPPNEPNGIHVAFDDNRLVVNAGLLLLVTFAQRLGLRELAGKYVDLGNAPGRANAGDNMLTLVASALAGATTLTTPTSCAPVGRLAPSAAWSRRRPPCATSSGATSARRIG